MLNAIYKLFMLNVVTLNVVMLSVMDPCLIPWQNKLVQLSLNLTLAQTHQLNMQTFENVKTSFAAE
jgi:hypothetical protein